MNATQQHPSTQPAAAQALVRAKDLASTAVVLTGAAIAWFGWGLQGGRHQPALIAGMIASALALVAALAVTRTIAAPPTLALNAAVRRAYWVAVTAEVLLIAGGAVALGVTGNGQWLSTWTALVMGVHFVPLARAFSIPLLHVTAAGCVLVVGLAIWAGLTGWAAAPTITGAGTGIVPDEQRMLDHFQRMIGT